MAGSCSDSVVLTILYIFISLGNICEPYTFGHANSEQIHTQEHRIFARQADNNDPIMYISPDNIVGNNTDGTAEEGDSVALHCITDATNVKYVTWSHDSTLLVNDTQILIDDSRIDFRQSLSSTAGTYSVIINQLNRHDSGLYTCSVYYGNPVLHILAEYNLNVAYNATTRARNFITIKAESPTPDTHAIATKPQIQTTPTPTHNPSTSPQRHTSIESSSTSITSYVVYKPSSSNYFKIGGLALLIIIILALVAFLSLLGNAFLGYSLQQKNRRRKHFKKKEDQKDYKKRDDQNDVEIALVEGEGTNSVYAEVNDSTPLQSIEETYEDINDNEQPIEHTYLTTPQKLQHEANHNQSQENTYLPPNIEEHVKPGTAAKSSLDQPVYVSPRPSMEPYVNVSTLKQQSDRVEADDKRRQVYLSIHE